MAMIVAPSWSIATTFAFLVPARALVSVPELASTVTGRLDDLRLVVFAGSERGAVLRLDLVLVMRPSQGLRDAVRRTTSAPPRPNSLAGLDPKPRISDPSPHSNARFA